MFGNGGTVHRTEEGIALTSPSSFKWYFSPNNGKRTIMIMCVIGKGKKKISLLKVRFAVFHAGLYEDYDMFHRLAEIEKAWPGAAILMFKAGKLPKVR